MDLLLARLQLDHGEVDLQEGMCRIFSLIALLGCVSYAAAAGPNGKTQDDKAGLSVQKRSTLPAKLQNGKNPADQKHVSQAGHHRVRPRLEHKPQSQLPPKLKDDIIVKKAQQDEIDEINLINSLRNQKPNHEYIDILPPGVDWKEKRARKMKK